ncbi:MAG: nucleotidyltransferase domain-containing protein [Alphaproteobacteria bacterium]|nr:nucleotidyltransferase domain-containing protein [Alphaproteobacteria bacterium]
MRNWEKALNQFLNSYKNQPYVEGALLCGSYVTGNQNQFSDIDVHILLSDTQNWRERGVISQDGFLIEYFLNPIKKIQQEFHDDYLDGGNASANMFAYGRILFDKQGYVKQLQDEANKSLKKTPRKWGREELSLDLYGAWNLMDELNSLSSDKKPFQIPYYELAKTLLGLYFKIKGIPKISLAKLERILTDPDFAERYHIQKLPDKTFTELFLSVIQAPNIEKIQKLYDFVIKSVGGFDITTFKIKSELNK